MKRKMVWIGVASMIAVGTLAGGAVADEIDLVCVYGNVPETGTEASFTAYGVTVEINHFGTSVRLEGEGGHAGANFTKRADTRWCLSASPP